MIQNLHSINSFYFPSQTHASRDGTVACLPGFSAHFFQVFRLYRVPRHGRSFRSNCLGQAFVVHHAHHELGVVANRGP
jgi:hypothetical protein